MKYSKNYGFALPTYEDEDLADIGVISLNFKTVDEVMKKNEDLGVELNKFEAETLDAVGRLNTKDADLQSQIDALGGVDVSELQAQIDTANTDISALKTTDEDLQAQINSLSSVDMSQIQQQLEVLGDASRITRTYNNMTVAVGAKLRKGEVFQTLGFSKVGDGGAGVYYITDTTWGDDNNPCYLPYGEGLYARYIYKQKANVMALGAKNDNSTDCSDIINRFFNSEGTVNHTLYFPKGTYRCENPISYAPTSSSRHINIEGCRPSRSARAYMYTSDGVQKPTVTSLSILYFPIADKTEGFTAIDLDCTYAHIKNIHILSDSGEFEILENDGKKWDYRPVDEDGNPIPYNPLQYTAKLENVNGIDGSKLTRFCLDGVGITGFSGYGTTCNKQCDFKDVYVQACGVGIKQTSSDAMLYDCYVTGCNVGIQCSDGVLFAYNIFIDQIVTHAIKGTENGQTSLNISGCIDHIGYSAIYLNRSYDNKVDVRMGRCGMYYGGVALENIPNNFEELSKASNISIQNLSHGTFHLSTYLRDITDDDNDICALPVYLLNGGTWSNASVFGTYPDEYEMLTPIMSGDSNISVYTSSGHYVTYNVGDTVGLVNINDKITDLTARIETLEENSSGGSGGVSQAVLIDWDVNTNGATQGTVTKDANGLHASGNASLRIANYWRCDASAYDGITFTAYGSGKLRVEVGGVEGEYKVLGATPTTYTIAFADIGLTELSGIEINLQTQGAYDLTVSDIYGYTNL